MTPEQVQAKSTAVMRPGNVDLRRAAGATVLQGSVLRAWRPNAPQEARVSIWLAGPRESSR